MRKTILAALCGLSLAAPAVADARQVIQDRYSGLWHACLDKPGCDPGRNIRRHGILDNGHARSPVQREWLRSIATLDRWLHPVAPPVVASAAAAPQTASTAPQTGGSGGLPACADESHGNYSTGPGNTNASTGATGRWQTLRSHYNRGGICQEYDLSPAGQDGCAHKIMREQGASAWVGC